MVSQYVLRTKSSGLIENRFKLDEAIRGNCPAGPGVTTSLPNREFEIAMDGKPYINQNLHIQFPAGWGVAVSKRDVAGRLEYEEEEQNTACKGIYYADTYHWVGENSLWVVKGTKDNHQALDRYYEETPETDFVEFIRALGAVYYHHCESSMMVAACSVSISVSKDLLTLIGNEHKGVKSLMARSLEQTPDGTSAPVLAPRFEEIDATDLDPNLKVPQLTDFQ